MTSLFDDDATALCAHVQDILSFEHDPLAYVRYAYPWGEGELDGSPGPRKWQREVLGDIGKHLKNPKTRHQPLRVAVASGHGIGKSALIGQISSWGLSTKIDTKILITANTEPQLRTKTWPEITKWFKLSNTGSWFNIQTTKIESTDSEHSESWQMVRTTWSEHNTEAFAGLHNMRKRIIVIFDEASSIADKVWEVTDGALTDENTEIIWIAFGNPTRNTGRFRECFRKFKNRWITRQIDSRDVEGTNKEELARQIEDNGVDSDFVKIRIRGMFPSASMKQFIAEADVDKAFGKHLREDQYTFAPKIISVDPAWEGDDDLVIGLRQGLAFKILHTMKKNDNDVMVANIIARFEDEEKADAVFIDGGYGTGIVSVGRTLNRDWQLVWFSERPFDVGCLNKRAEMWKDMRDWLKSGGAIPKDQGLRDEICAPETVPRLDGKLQLESKQDMKKRGEPSPNKADALAITFAFPVSRKEPIISGKSHHQYDYNPFDPKG